MRSLFPDVDPNCRRLPDPVKRAIAHDYHELWLYGRTSGRSSRHALRRTDGSQQFKRRRTVHHPTSIKYLAFAWGVGTNKPKAYYDSTKTKAMSKPVFKKHHGQSVIDSLEFATQWSTSERLFSEAYVARNTPARARGTAAAAQHENARLKREAAMVWKSGGADRVFWQFARRCHLDTQPFVRNKIIGHLRKNPAASYSELSAVVDHWCSTSTIQRWLKTHDCFQTKKERIIPLLSAAQREKHVAFARRFRNLWGLRHRQDSEAPAAKFLLVHYDEKWFYGLLARGNAKRCAALGLTSERTGRLRAYHRNHINKVMVVAAVAYAFEGNIENGGDGIKLGLFRCQAAKIAKKTVRKSRWIDGKVRYDGDIVRRKGDSYLVDVTVSGSDDGCSSHPKFALLRLFVDVLFPMLELLVAPCGRFPGYTVVIQGDNAGPHVDATFSREVLRVCAPHGWHWEPQAPQMPHSNVLDLSIFPAMSRRHSSRLRDTGSSMSGRGDNVRRGVSVASSDRIFTAAQEVWTEYPSSNIARAFVLAHRILLDVVRRRGDNGFLADGSLHFGVRKDFVDTATGIKRA